MRIVFESGSGKWIRFRLHDVQFVSDRSQATTIHPDDLGGLVLRHNLAYCRHTLVLQEV